MIHTATTQPRRMSAEQRLARLGTNLMIVADDLRHLVQDLGPDHRLLHDSLTIALLCVGKTQRAVARIAVAVGTIEVQA